jgi:hypothetical protein
MIDSWGGVGSGAKAMSLRHQRLVLRSLKSNRRRSPQPALFQGPVEVKTSDLCHGAVAALAQTPVALARVAN